MRLRLALLAALFATSAVAQDREPEWIRRPNASDLMTVFPRLALEKGIGGRVMLFCIATVQGTLRGCKVESQTPADVGFGAAALAVPTQFVLRPAMKDGKPVEYAVRIPITFPKPERALGSFIAPTTQGPQFKANLVYARMPYLAAPSVQDVLAAFPAKARERKAGGSVSLNCRIEAEGRLGSCSTIKEEPDNLGLGAAARTLIPKFVVPDKDGKGESTAGARTIILITFAADSLDGTPSIGRPRWLAQPTLQDVAAVLPRDLLRTGAKGQAVMDCVIGPDGRLQGCEAKTEQPVGHGYGQAAVALAPRFRTAIWTEEGLPTVGASVHVPVGFDVKIGPPAAAPAPGS